MTDNTTGLDSGIGTTIPTDNESKLPSALKSIFACSANELLWLEIQAWDMLSDEAFRNFEQALI